MIQGPDQHNEEFKQEERVWRWTESCTCIMIKFDAGSKWFSTQNALFHRQAAGTAGKVTSHRFIRCTRQITEMNAEQFDREEGMWIWVEGLKRSTPICELWIFCTLDSRYKEKLLFVVNHTYTTDRNEVPSCYKSHTEASTSCPHRSHSGGSVPNDWREREKNKSETAWRSDGAVACLVS